MKLEEWKIQDFESHGVMHYDFNILKKLCKIWVRYPVGNYKYPIAIIGIRKSSGSYYRQTIFTRESGRPKANDFYFKEDLDVVKFKMDLILKEKGFDPKGIAFGLS